MQPFFRMVGQICPTLCPTNLENFDNCVGYNLWVSSLSPKLTPKIQRKNMPPIKKMSVEDVLTIRRLLSSCELAERDSFGMIEPLNRGKLESAVARQMTGHGEIFKYDTVEAVGATLFYGIVMSHAFENGNKRTGLITLLIFLDQNRSMLVEVDEDELYQFTRSVAAHEIALPDGLERNSDSEVESITRWIEQHSRTKILGDRAIKFPELRVILEALGCTFESPKKNFIKIRRRPYMTNIGYPRQDFELSIDTIKKIRKDLHLSEIDGVDSSGFYDYAAGVTTFVNTHRNLLKRLAAL